MLYAAGAIFIKVAISRGVNSWMVTFMSNLAVCLLFLPLLFFGRGTWHPEGLPWAVAAGCMFFAGQIGTFRSLAAGDVSIATPALASKVIFVALLSLGLPSNHPHPDLWLAVALTMIGVILLHRGPSHHAVHPFATAAWALFAAFAFAATDVVVQAQTPRTGFTLFMPVMFGMVGVLSFPILLPRALRAARIPARIGAWKWAAAGVAILALQCVAVAASIGIFGEATAVNIVYSSRGLWSIVLLAWLARRLGMAEGQLDRKTFRLRLLGSILILAAVVIVLL